MAVLKVEFDNILCFNGFKADFTYKKKLVKPLLDEEYLRDFPNIRYKKVNIIIGSNASGKTALGKAIWVTLRFLCNKEAERIKEVVADKDKEAYILLDSIHSNGEFFRAEIKVSPTEGVLVRYNALTANKTDSYNSLIKRLDLNKPFRNYVVELENAIPLEELILLIVKGEIPISPHKEETPLPESGEGYSFVDEDNQSDDKERVIFEEERKEEES